MATPTGAWPQRGGPVTWLVEEGIGEDRAIRLNGAMITDTLIDWHGDLHPGQVEDARLFSKQAGSPRGVARFASGEKALVDQLPSNASEGALVRLEVTRSAIQESRRTKLAQARPTTQEPRKGSSLADQLREKGQAVEIVRRFPECDWDELVGEALDQRVIYSDGTLHFSPTPAMTLIDIDTGLSPERGALAAVGPIATSLRRFGVSGSIGIDFPTINTKAGRKAVDDALAEALADWPHERTAMNGFGFIQLVARRDRSSLLELLTFRRSRAEIYRLLRQAEQLDGPGALELRGDAALFEVWLEPDTDLIEELARRTGREVRIIKDDSLEWVGPHAQLVPR